MRRVGDEERTFFTLHISVLLELFYSMHYYVKFLFNNKVVILNRSCETPVISESSISESMAPRSPDSESS